MSCGFGWMNLCVSFFTFYFGELQVSGISLRLTLWNSGVMNLCSAAMMQMAMLIWQPNCRNYGRPWER